MLDSSQYAKILVGIFVIVNPLGMVPAFLSLTSNRTPKEAAATARTAAITACLILLVAAVSGTAILKFFGIGVPAFRLAGGLLLLFVGIDMLHAKQSRHQQTPGESREAQDKEQVGIVPLAIPLLAGPAAMSTVVLYAHEGSHWYHTAIVCGMVVFVCAVVYVAFRLGVRIARLLGKTGINVFTRLMGLILVALAFEFMTGGLSQIFPGWKG
ncbi:MarC family protein [Thermodesulfobacteriota bacterium]